MEATRTDRGGAGSRTPEALAAHAHLARAEQLAKEAGARWDADRTEANRQTWQDAVVELTRARMEYDKRVRKELLK